MHFNLHVKLHSTIVLTVHIDGRSRQGFKTMERRMKNSKKTRFGFIFALAATSLVIATWGVMPAEAGEFTRGHGYGLKPLHYLFNYRLNQYPRRLHRRPGAYRLRARAKHGYRNTGSRCQSVTKTSYDDYGHKVLISGIGCYDRYGNFTVVPESRHIIGKF